MSLFAVACKACFPSIDTDDTPQEQQRSLEEQRRLFYVAITRTRQTLILSSMTGLPAAAAFKLRAGRPG